MQNAKCKMHNVGRHFVSYSAYALWLVPLAHRIFFYIDLKFSDNPEVTFLRIPKSEIRICEASFRIRRRSEHYAFFPLVKSLIAKSEPTIRTVPMGRAMYQWGTKPAMMYVTKDTPATVIA